MRIAFSETFSDAEIFDLVCTPGRVLASGVGCVGVLSDSVAVVTALPDRRDSGRVGARAGLGPGDFACKDTAECMISISP
jgi:hypothetical protein